VVIFLSSIIHFLFTDTAPSEIYTLSLHDALPILIAGSDGGIHWSYDGGRTWEYVNSVALGQFYELGADMRRPYYICGGLQDNGRDRKSTRLNSSHLVISYAVFCLKKKNKAITPLK